MEIGAGTRMSNAVLGDCSYCDRNCDICNARVEKFANVASFVRIGARDHPLDRASLHHFMYRSADCWQDAKPDADWFEHRTSRLEHVGHDTRIGQNAQVKPEVTVGHGAVVASGAVVTKDVVPYTIVAGFPAQPIRRRLPEELAQRMIVLACCDWHHDRMRAALDDFRALKADAFLENYGG